VVPIVVESSLAAGRVTDAGPSAPSKLGVRTCLRRGRVEEDCFGVDEGTGAVEIAAF
jgi:hypothetical protein